MICAYPSDRRAEDLVDAGDSLDRVLDRLEHFALDAFR